LHIITMLVRIPVFSNFSLQPAASIIRSYQQNLSCFIWTSSPIILNYSLFTESYHIISYLNLPSGPPPNVMLRVSRCTTFASPATSSRTPGAPPVRGSRQRSRERRRPVTSPAASKSSEQGCHWIGMGTEMSKEHI
jgi:hypothetical protein